MSTTTFLKPPPSTRMTLRPDQEEAVARIIDELKFADRTQAVMACGTGKTVTAQRAAERFVADKQDPTVLIAVPNLVLVDQMISDWQSQMIPGAEFAVLPVNSRTTKRRRADDEFVVDIQGVTDDPEAIAAFLAGAGRKLIVTTYQSMRHIAEALALVRAQTPGFELDLIIADEAHRTAGTLKADQQSPFKLVLDNEAVPASKRVFMTATPRISKLNSKSDTDSAAASMGNPEVYGDRAITRSLRWAVEKKLLAPYRTYVVQISDGDLEAVLENNPILRLDGQAAEARQIAAAIALAKSAANNNLGGIVTYHSRIDAAQEFTRILRAVVDALPEGEIPSGKLTVGHINGGTPADERSSILATLDSSTRKAGDWSVVTNCSCLTEGVNVPSMDAIMFVDPRRSVVANVQAIGRPMRRDPNNPNKVASILLPVFVGTAKSPEQALEEGVFNGVYEVIKSLKDVDDALSELFINGLTATTISHEPGMEIIAIEDPETGIIGHDSAPIRLVAPRHRGEGAEFWTQWHRELRLLVLKESTDGWEQGLSAIRSFADREGHTSVPRHHVENGFPLGNWVHNRRSIRETLTPAVKATLESLPKWQWSAQDGRWESFFRALEEFSAREGHCNVPVGHVENGVQLGSWVRRQRSDRASGKATAARQVRLESLTGWGWNHTYDAEWEQWSTLLQQYVAREGHALVPGPHIEGGRDLGRWVASVRKRKDTLSDVRISSLEAMTGWAWDAVEASFNEGIAHVRKFVETNGHALIPVNFIQDGFKLGQWVVVRRRSGRNVLKAEHLTLLESFPGWTWDVKMTLFEENIRSYARYRARTGTGLVSKTHREDGLNLRGWLSTCRRRLAKGTLSPECTAMLDEIDSVWRSGGRPPALAAS